MENEECEWYLEESWQDVEYEEWWEDLEDEECLDMIMCMILGKVSNSVDLRISPRNLLEEMYSSNSAMRSRSSTLKLGSIIR